MAVEAATYISDLVPATIGNTTDPIEGGAQVNLVKTVLQNSFPNIAGAVTASHAEINYLDITTLGTAQASKALTVSAGSAINATGITWTSLGTVTTMDLNGGTIDGTPIGGSSAAAGTFTTLTANTSFVLNGSTALTSVDTDLSSVSGSHDTLATAKAVKDYVDSVTGGGGGAGEGYATEAYVDARAKVVYSGGTNIISASGANLILIPIGVNGTVSRFDVTSTSFNLSSVTLKTSSSTDMASVTPTAGAIVSDTSISNATVTAGTYLRLTITESGLGNTYVAWSIVVDL